MELIDIKLGVGGRGGEGERRDLEITSIKFILDFFFKEEWRNGKVFALVGDVMLREVLLSLWERDSLYGRCRVVLVLTLAGTSVVGALEEAGETSFLLLPSPLRETGSTIISEDGVEVFDKLRERAAVQLSFGECDRVRVRSVSWEC